ncbi:MAG: Gfo/Idh/MocA family oxidoreductase [Bacteroidales bacterium]|jgi:predicted dehydrogenase|nr:Gfo/Idh/MocA family oxidoreductase [Bacteroidales bacterium]
MTKRRDFIKTGILGTAGLTIGGAGFSSGSYRSIIGSNDRINVAVVGLKGQGGTHVGSYCGLKDSKNVRVKTLCDVDEQFFASRIKTVVDRTGETPGTEWDIRKVLEDKDIHAVSLAIPNFWHALATVWACQAGKHVYVEKPATHLIFEGRKMVEAARKYNVRVQTGTQNRSIPQVIEAIKFLHSGGIGDVFMAKGLCFKPRDSFGISPDSTPPASLHYDMWLGPCQMQPYNEKKVHYNWHWHWATGGGDTANQGPHQFDIARWGLNKNEHPETVYSMGNIYGISPAECSQETPNTQTSVLKYKDGKILEFETRGRYTNAEGGLGIRIGNLFYGTEGYMEIDGDTWNAYRKRESKPFAGSGIGEKSNDPTFMAPPGGSSHYGNFIDAIRSGKNEDLHADILEGYMSAVLPALSNISYRVGRQLKFDGAKEKFVNDPEADKLLTRDYRKPYVVGNTI